MTRRRGPVIPLGTEPGRLGPSAAHQRERSAEILRDLFSRLRKPADEWAARRAGA